MVKKNEPKTGMPRLMELAATKKPLMIGSVILSALASIASFIPYIAIYLIVQEIIGVYPNIAGLNADKVISYGWLAFGGMAGNILLYFGALMCSHLAAFGTLYELKVNFASQLAKVPLGFHVLVGSGKLRKIMDENIEKIEGFIAHQLPDIVAAFVAPIVMAVILLAVDWRFGIAAIASIAAALYFRTLYCLMILFTIISGSETQTPAAMRYWRRRRQPAVMSSWISCQAAMTPYLVKRKHAVRGRAAEIVHRPRTFKGCSDRAA